MSTYTPDIVQVGKKSFKDTCYEVPTVDISKTKIKELVTKLKDTLKLVGGVGLAAPQLGSNLQIFVIGIAPTRYRPDLQKIPTYTVINPDIISYDIKVNYDFEGCFSVAEANLFCSVRRPNVIDVKYVDLKGKLVTRTIKGFEARVFQHEYDHLHSKVFLECDVDLETLMSANEYKLMQLKK